MSLPLSLPLTVIVTGVFAGTYGLILSDRFHKPSAALLGATLMVGTGVLKSADIATALNLYLPALGVLLGMFIIASSLREAGFFEWMGLHMARSVNAHPLMMYILLPLMTAGMASLLDIVTVALFVVPLTVEVLDGLAVDPVPFVIAEVLAANIGGVSTMVGDPTNVIIGTSLHLSFNDFLLNTAPAALAILALNVGILYVRNHRFLRKETALKHSKDNVLLLRRPSELVKDRGLLRVSILALVLAIGFLIAHQTLDISPALAALLPASVILVYESSRSSEMKHVLGRINWEIFFFFGGLFLLVAGLQNTGLLSAAGQEMVQASSGNAMLAVTLVLWSSALLSQIVDNVPLVTVLVPVVNVMQVSGLPLLPLAWALALGAGIGGMATPIGTASNVVALSILNKDRKRLGFAKFAKRSIPLTILDLVIVNVILLLRL